MSGVITFDEIKKRLNEKSEYTYYQLIALKYINPLEKGRKIIYNIYIYTYVIVKYR